MSGFDDVRLPDDIEKGSTGGPQFFTSLVQLVGGAEARNQNWTQARCTYDISYGISADTAPIVVAFFRARRGRLRGFRFKDWSDFTATSQAPIGAADGVNRLFQLAKTYADDVATFVRPITRPVVGSVTVFLNGVPTSAFVLLDKGVVQINTAPAAGTAIRCTFDFDVPVRFDNDKLALAMETAEAAAVSSINLTEIIE